jgi:carbon-monoxide dehydrogenase large subunit
MPHLQIERLVVGLPSKSYQQTHHRPALAGDEVVHAGEPVAIVVAENRYVAEDAAAMVEVDYDPLPAVADCRDALAAGAPRVYRHAPHNCLPSSRWGMATSMALRRLRRIFASRYGNTAAAATRSNAAVPSPCMMRWKTG